MYDPKVIADELSDVLATETRGMLRHVMGSTPHVTQKTYPVFVLLQKIVKAGAHHAQRVTQLFEQLELSPRTRSYNPDVANYHFVTLASVLPDIVEEKQRQIAAYERAVEHIGDNAAAAAELQALLDENREQLEQIQSAISK